MDENTKGVETEVGTGECSTSICEDHVSRCSYKVDFRVYMVWVVVRYTGSKQVVGW